MEAMWAFLVRSTPSIVSTPKRGNVEPSSKRMDCTEKLNTPGRPCTWELSTSVTMASTDVPLVRRGPRSVHSFILRPIQAQHQYEFAIGCGEPVGLLLGSGGIPLNVQVRGAIFLLASSLPGSSARPREVRNELAGTRSGLDH